MSERQPLTRDEVIQAVERKNPPRTPLVRAKWWGEGLGDQYGERLSELNRYPEEPFAKLPGESVLTGVIS